MAEEDNLKPVSANQPIGMGLGLGGKNKNNDAMSLAPAPAPTPSKPVSITAEETISCQLTREGEVTSCEVKVSERANQRKWPTHTAKLTPHNYYIII